MRLRYFIIIFSILVLGALPNAKGQTLNPPELRCISVEGNGDISINWIIPPDPQNIFEEYSVFISSSIAGPYTLAFITTGYATTNVTDVGAGANSGSLFYYAVTKFDNGNGPQSSGHSDTLQSIFIQVNAIANQANLSWDPIHTPELPSSKGMYYIYKKNTVAEQWEIIDSTQYGSEFFTDLILQCRDSGYYKVEIHDLYGCISTSAVSGELIGDDMPPDAPIIDSVSVDITTGNVVIGWQQSIAGDVEGYIIAHNNNPWELIDTVAGQSYVHTTALPDTRSEQYGIAAHDSCWWGNPVKPNTSSTGILHQTMFLEGNLNQCQREIRLSWNPYVNWSGGVGDYSIYVSENGGSRNLLTTISSNQTSFTHVELSPNSSYCYFVRAYEGIGNRTSTSNKSCITVSVPQEPLQHYLTHVTVNESKEVEVQCYVDLDAAVLFYDLKRAKEKLGPFKSIQQQFPGTNELITFYDATALTDEFNYYYKVEAIDLCSNPIRISNLGRTILTVGEVDNVNLLNTLIWNKYEDWKVYGNGVGYYNVYRSYSNNKSLAELIATLKSSDTSFVDNVSREYDEGGTFCYYLEAVEAPGNTFELSEGVSQSNMICMTIEPRIFIPNAFTGDFDGLNDVFKPVGAFVDAEDYYFAVYDRWGHSIFITTDIDKGWNGEYSDTQAPEGVYVYHVIFTGADGEKIVRRGAITLVR